MKIDMLGVQAFVAIADQGGFGKAAAALHLTQTALSRRLQNLERYLGVVLIERTTRTLALTRIGQSFLPQARRLLGEMSAALTEIRETGRALRGDVTLACVPTVGIHYLPRVLQLYAARHPHNRIKVLDHASAAVAQAVLTREAEFGINVAETTHPDLAAEPVLEDDFVLVVRSDHPLAGAKRVAWRRLAGHRLIYPGAGSSNRPLLDLALADAKPELAAYYEVQRSSTAVGLVAEGVGIAVVPRLAWQRGAYPSLRVVSLVSPQITRTFSLLTRRHAELSPAARTLHALIREQARAGRGTARFG